MVTRIRTWGLPGGQGVLTWWTGPRPSALSLSRLATGLGSWEQAFPPASAGCSWPQALVAEVLPQRDWPYIYNTLKTLCAPPVHAPPEQQGRPLARGLPSPSSITGHPPALPSSKPCIFSR